VSKEEFSRLKKKGFFLESQKVLEDYYGTPKLFYLLAKKKSKSLILCIDVKGGIYLKKNQRAGRIITIFIAAPSKKELYKRMQKRQEPKSLINKRIKLAVQESKLAKQYDYLITNKNVKTTLEKLEAIILSGSK
jgi:guanylate kinase